VRDYGYEDCEIRDAELFEEYVLKLEEKIEGRWI